MRYLLAANNTLVIRGPASIGLLNGDAKVLGGPLNREQRLVVRAERQVPVEANSEVDLEVLLGQSGKISEIHGSTIPESWRSTAGILEKLNQGKVMVIGATDVGKSSLCTYITNELYNKKMKLRIVDGDIGQADIGPPTTVGMAIPTEFLSSLVDLKPEALVFIGHTTPGPVETRLIQRIQRLADGDTTSLTIVNTDGWVLDAEAISYKIRLIEAVDPDLVIGISPSNDLQPILSGSGARSLRVRAAESVLTRSRGDRRELRTAGYRRFLDGGRVRIIPLEQVQVELPRKLPCLHQSLDSELRSVIVGLLNEAGLLLQIGVLLEVQKDAVKVYSKPAEGVRKIELGYVKLSTEGVELGYLE